MIDGGQVVVAEARPAFNASLAIDWNTRNKQVVTMTANITSLTMSGGVAGATYRLELCQDATGGRYVTGWGSNILFYTGDLTNSTSTPGMTTAPSTCNIFTIDVSSATGTLIYQSSLPLKGK